MRVADVTRGIESTLSSPETMLWQMTDDQPVVTVPMVGFAGFFRNTDIGAAGLVAGTYKATFKGDPHGNGDIVAFLVYYMR